MNNKLVYGFAVAIVSLSIVGSAQARAQVSLSAPVPNLQAQYSSLKGSYIGQMQTADGRNINIRLTLIPTMVVATNAQPVRPTPTLVGRIDVCMTGFCKPTDDESTVVAAITFNESHFEPSTKQLVMSSTDSSSGQVSALNATVNGNFISGVMVSASAVSHAFWVVKAIN